MSERVRAAGGIVVRRQAEGTLRVLLVHRPRYDDWSFPKGKALAGETDEDCALREVREETGLECALGVELTTTSYVDSRGRPKIVRYWAMTPLRGEFAPHDEVDEVAWFDADAARRQLTYVRDHAVLDELMNLYAALDS